jgi:hypothetical protein
MIPLTIARFLVALTVVGLCYAVSSVVIGKAFRRIGRRYPTAAWQCTRYIFCPRCGEHEIAVVVGTRAEVDEQAAEIKLLHSLEHEMAS